MGGGGGRAGWVRGGDEQQAGCWWVLVGAGRVLGGCGAGDLGAVLEGGGLAGAVALEQHALVVRHDLHALKAPPPISPSLPPSLSLSLPLSFAPFPPSLGVTPQQRPRATAALRGLSESSPSGAGGAPEGPPEAPRPCPGQPAIRASAAAHTAAGVLATRVRRVLATRRAGQARPALSPRPAKLRTPARGRPQPRQTPRRPQRTRPASRAGGGHPPRRPRRLRAASATLPAGPHTDCEPARHPGGSCSTASRPSRAAAVRPCSAATRGRDPGPGPGARGRDPGPGAGGHRPRGRASAPLRP